MTEWDAGDYARQSTLQQVMAQEQLCSLTLVGNERVLDVGCGDGKITAEISARVPRGSVLGVDPSRDMVAFAARQFASSNHPNLRFEVGDARSLPYRSEFDLVVSFNALHWVPEQSAALRSLYAALKPTGRTVLRFVPDGPRKSLEDIIEDVRQSTRWSPFFADFHKPFIHVPPQEYRLLAEQSGFRVDSLNVRDVAWDFKARDAFSAFARATFVEWTRRLPESDRPAFIADVLDAYRTVAADSPEARNVFRFYQMEITLALASGV